MPTRVIILVLSAFFALPQAFGAWVSDTQSIMGTEVRVVLWHDEEDKGYQAVAEVMDEMRRIDNRFSYYKPNSELSVINRDAAQKPLKVSEEMAIVLQKALFYGNLTGGVFDITFASVGQYYDYRNASAPSRQQEQQAVIDYKKVLLNEVERTVTFEHPDLKIDLGGIVKGYAVDKAIKILQRQGVSSATVSAGGDSYILGDRRGRQWRVGIKSPRSDGVALMLPLESIAFSTSGDYERFYINPDTGERVHHIINPSTKQSASGVMSVSVVGPNGFDTDPLSTSVFILGVEKGLALVNRLPGFDAVIIDSNSKVHYSDGLAIPE